MQPCILRNANWARLQSARISAGWHTRRLECCRPFRFPPPLLTFPSPAFCPMAIPPVPHLPIEIAFGVALRRGSLMGTTQDHRRFAEECVAMARRSDDDNDKALWLTLAQSWVRLAEHAARSETSAARSPDEGDEIPDAASADRQ